MSTTQLLDRATAILDGTLAVPIEQRVVAAALMARSGLEMAVTEWLCDRGLDLRRARMASRLTVFSALSGTDLGATARLAWTGLSRACHRHAFDLPPNVWEVRDSITNVRALHSELGG
jgi:hypothetical protein